MATADVVVMLAATIWTVAIGVSFYAAGVRRGLALATSDDASVGDDGWDWSDDAGVVDDEGA